MATSSNNVPEDSPYFGQPLGPRDIRLLKILSIGGTVEFQTEQHELTPELEFDAISYVWGTQPASVQATCNGKFLSVTPTLREMLEHLHLHRPSTQHLMWIDAICINQKDLDEKAVQIPLMRDIYSRAARVIVWTGPSIPEMEAFAAEFPRLSEIAKKLTAAKVEITAPGIWEVVRWPLHGHPFWTGLFYLLGGVWFRRLWTFQEIVLSRKAVMLCGAHSVDWDDFAEFAMNAWFGDSGYIPADPNVTWKTSRMSSLAWLECRMILRCRSVLQSGNGSIGLIDVPWALNLVRSRQVKEPVDRIWAVAGLFNENLQKELAPLIDYSAVARKEYWRTYVAFAKVFLRKEPSLRLLCIPPPTGGKDNSLPSWCPTFSDPESCFMHITSLWNCPVRHPSQHLRLALVDEDEGKTTQRLMAVEYHSRRYVHISEKDDLLRVRGFCVDVISEVIEDRQLLGVTDYRSDSEWEIMNNNNPVHVAATKWASRSLELARRAVYGIEDGTSAVPPEYLMALYADCRINKQVEAAYLDAVSFMGNPELRHIWQLESSRRKRAMLCIRRLRAISGHSFFSTERGRIGLATPGCKPGDKICVFYGGHPMHILRQPGRNNAVNPGNVADVPAEFVGVAFIPHLMEPHQSDAARLGTDEIFVIG